MNSNMNSALYNNFLSATKIPHQIIQHMITSKSESAEMLWKLLKYDDIDCLSKDNLTTSEKKSLRYLNQSKQEGHKIFLKPLVSESLTNANNQTLMKMYELIVQPIDRLTAIINFEIDFYVNESASLVIYDGAYVEKTSLMQALFLDLFNGKNIDVGISCLEFDRNLSRTAQSILDISNSKTFYGKSLVMALKYSDLQEGTKCG